MKKICTYFMILATTVLTGCTVFVPPIPMLETQVYNEINKIQKVAPTEKIYRQYAGDGRYFQFERISEDNVIYGWFTCTDCKWTRSKTTSVYDGSYLYLIYGQHEEFFLQAPKMERHHPDFSHWSWSVIEKFQIEGRNLIKRGQIRRCDYSNPQIKEWGNKPYSYDGDFDCRREHMGSYQQIYVATIDETLTGVRSSIVGAKNDALDTDVRAKLRELKALYDDGLITDEEYQTKRQELLNSL